jgi:hypothetical protein
LFLDWLDYDQGGAVAEINSKDVALRLWCGEDLRDELIKALEKDFYQERPPTSVECYGEVIELGPPEYGRIICALLTEIRNLRYKEDQHERKLKAIVGLK